MQTDARGDVAEVGLRPCLPQCLVQRRTLEAARERVRGRAGLLPPRFQTSSLQDLAFVSSALVWKYLGPPGLKEAAVPPDMASPSQGGTTERKLKGPQGEHRGSALGHDTHSTPFWSLVDLDFDQNVPRGLS